MKKLLYVLIALFCILSCTKNEEIPVIDEPQVEKPVEDPKPVEGKDSVYYSLSEEGYELVAATESGISLFLQTDTTFAFRCLYDSCKTDRLVAYCDSSGVVERFIVEDCVYDLLYHADKSKLDILCMKDGKMEWIKDVDNPYLDLSSRASEENVPYSAISVVSNLSYAVYKIIDTYPLYMKKKIYGMVKLYAMPPVLTPNAVQMIAGLLGESFDETTINQQYSTIATVMSNYSHYVMNELYGGAIPLTHTWVERVGNDSVRVRCHVNDVDSLKSNFRISVLIEDYENNSYRPYHAHNYIEDQKSGFTHKKCTLIANYNSGKTFYEFTSGSLPMGKKYKFRAHLLPAASSKYLSGMKCLLDYRRFGQSDYFYLLEAKSKVVSEGVDNATISVSTQCRYLGGHKKVTLGVYYGTNPALPEDERMKSEVEVDLSSYESVSEDIVLSNLTPNETYYYMPYIKYDGNIVNRKLANMLDVIYDEDKIFCGEKGTFKTVDDNSIREVLVRIYNECNGVNWSYQKNWCSDLPITEWQGVKRDENGVYHFEFMEINELTGTFTIENCSEPICLYPCWYNLNSGLGLLEGLHLKNCSRIITLGINNSENDSYNTLLDVIPGLKTLYLDNVTLVVEPKEYITFQIENQDLENVIIKNIKTNLMSDVLCSFIIYTSQIKKLHFDEISNYDIQIKGPSINEMTLSNCEHITGFLGECNITNMIIENNKDEKTDDFNINTTLLLSNVQVENLTINNQNTQIVDDFSDVSSPSIIKELYCMGKSELEETYLHLTNVSETNIETINLTNTILTLDEYGGKDWDDEFIFPGNNMLKSLEMKNSHILNNIYIGNCKNLNRAIFDNVSLRDISFNGCVGLNSLYFGDYFNQYAGCYINGVIDVRNTPSLKEFSCQGDIKGILFDSHMNDVDIECRRADILQEIPNCYTGEGSGSFRYDQRYEYIYKQLPDGSEEYEKTIDHGRGWWYPGEPDKKYHGRGD